TAAVILEPILGEAGVITPPEGYLRAARSAADRNDALLILDEVQTGVGRTGAWFAWQDAGVVPDVMTLAKGLGGGLPIGACVAFGAARDVLVPGDHGSTFGGNPVACAAALATLDVIGEEGLATRAADVGDWLAKHLGTAPGVTEVRGAGLMRAFALADPVAKQFETVARAAGFLVNAIGSHTIRVVPPLVITDDELDRFVDAVPLLVQRAAEAAA
ncbi:MAG: aspartate aminotransferase family protein, partial [Mycobacteriales bacterium]